MLRQSENSLGLHIYSFRYLGLFLYSPYFLAVYKVNKLISERKQWITSEFKRCTLIQLFCEGDYRAVCCYDTGAECYQGTSELWEILLFTSIGNCKTGSSKYTEICIPFGRRRKISHSDRPYWPFQALENSRGQELNKLGDIVPRGYWRPLLSHTSGMCSEQGCLFRGSPLW